MQLRLGESILPIDWYQFNAAVEMIYRALGKENIQKNTNLLGIQVDLYFEEKVDGKRKRVAVNCLYRSNTIPLRDVESVKNLLDHLRKSDKVDVGLIVSNQTFSPEARAFAGANDITLEDFDILKQDLIYKLERHRGLAVPIAESLAAGLKEIQIPARFNSTIFVMMPFAQEYYDLYFYGISGCAQKLGLKCVRGDEIQHNSDVMQIVCDHIDRSDFLIAEVSEWNPNVFYELGWAHAKGKEPILLIKDGANIPFDLKSKNHLQYSSIRDCDDKLAKRLEAMVEAKKKTSSPDFLGKVGGNGS
jgi:hypothetical protein